MGMICGLVGVTSGQIHALRATPSLASDLASLAQHDGSKVLREQILLRMPAEKRLEAEARFQVMESRPEFQEGREQIARARARLAEIGPFEPALDLEKSWHMMHYVFTGDIGPINSPGDALMTGEDLGEDTTGYGPPRLHSPSATREFSEFLMPLDLEKLQSRMNYREMLRLGVYAMPRGPGSEAEYESGLRAELASYFPRLREYVSEMSEKQNGLLIWLT